LKIIGPTAALEQQASLLMLTADRDAHGYPDIRINPDNKLSGLSG